MAKDFLRRKQVADQHETFAHSGGGDAEAADGVASPAQAALDPASLPAPTGDPAHPGVVLKDGFYFFRDEYQLPTEPSVEEAETLYLGEVEKAFQNSWKLHPNLIAERTEAQIVKHAYDLDFRENEIKRIRDVLPVDKPVFDYIDALVDVVMLENLRIYVAKRLAAYRQLVRNTRWWFSVFLVIAAAVLLAGIALVPGISTLWPLAPIVAIAAALALTFVPVANLTWPYLIELQLKNTKEKYEEAVRDAAGLAASKLATKGRDVESLMNGLKNKLDTLSSSDASRVEQAPKLVRILLWSPERMGLIENYYRAKMDQFMVHSARVSIDTSVNTNGIIYNRAIFLSVLVLFFLLGLCGAGLVDLGGAIATAHAATPGASPAAAASPADPHAGAMVLTTMGLVFVAVAVVAFCATRLMHLSHAFEPEEISHHNGALLKNGVRAAILGAVLGVAPMVVIWTGTQAVLPTVALSAAVLLLAVVWFAIPVVFAHRIFRKYNHQYSSNVLEAVRRKMDASLWTRYSDLRIDQRIAEVFNAIYAAWYKADSKGVYQPPPQ